MKIKNIITKIVCIIAIITSILNIFVVKSKAMIEAQTYIVGTHYCDVDFSYKGVPVVTAFVPCQGLGVAYCLNKTLPGANVGDGRNINIRKFDPYEDFELWKIAVNCFPYRTLEELGVQTEDEGFAASKQAIYINRHGNDVNQYVGNSDSGVRVVNAIHKILEYAQNQEIVNCTGTYSVEEVNLNAEKTKDNWYIDLENKMLYKRYKIISQDRIGGIEVELPSDLRGIAQIRDLNKNEINRFYNEEFEIAIPYDLESRDIPIRTYVFLYNPTLYYGDPLYPNEQSYMLLNDSGYELYIQDYNQSYEKPQTSLEILKVDDDNNYLQNVEFNLLDENKNVVYENLVTDENGTIIIENLNYGTYYLKETKTIEGYILNENLLEIEVKFGKKLKIVVRNEKEPEIEEEQEPIIEIKKEKVIEEKLVSKIKYTKLPKTGM